MPQRPVLYEFFSLAVHPRGYMGEELMVAGAEVVQARLSVGRAAEAVLGTFAVTGKEKRTLLALGRQLEALASAEGLLLGTIEHLYQSVAMDVAQPVFRKDEVVAAIDIATSLHHRGMPTVGTQRTDPWCHTTPVGQGCIKQLYENLSHIFLNPNVKQPA